MCEPRNRDNGASDVWALTAYCPEECVTWRAGWVGSSWKRASCEPPYNVSPDGSRSGKVCGGGGGG